MSARGPTLAGALLGLTAAAGLLVLSAWAFTRALDPTLPLGVHGHGLWLATLPSWVAVGALLLVIGESSAGLRLRLGRATFVVFVLLSPPVSGLLCGALRWYQTAALAVRFRDARPAPALVTGVRWKGRTIERERPRRETVTVWTPWLQVAYTAEGRTHTTEEQVEEPVARAFEAQLALAAGPERAGVPHDVAWYLPGAPSVVALGPADRRPDLAVTGAVPTLLCAVMVVALVVAARRA